MESASVKVREWSLWAIGIAAFFGVTLSSVAHWFSLAIPAMSWLVVAVSVPWLGIAAFAVLSGIAGFLIGRIKRGPGDQGSGGTTTESIAESTNDEWKALFSTEKPPEFRPDDVQILILRALRWFDGVRARCEIIDFLNERHPGTSQNEIDLGLDELHRKGWIAGAQRFHPRGRQMAYQLARPGMEFSKAEGFLHSGQST